MREAQELGWTRRGRRQFLLPRAVDPRTTQHPPSPAGAQGATRDPVFQEAYHKPTSRDD